MDSTWLLEQSQGTAVVVPTRSLANALLQRHAQYHIEQGNSVWETPEILVWNDLVSLLFKVNSKSGSAKALINQTQSRLIWRRVIDQARGQDLSLSLLNSNLTSQAAHRSWRLYKDWMLNEQLDTAHNSSADFRQFLIWSEQYQTELNSLALDDHSTRVSSLLDAPIIGPFEQIIFYAFDLFTATQSAVIEQLRAQGQNVEIKRMPVSPKDTHSYGSVMAYQDDRQELIQTLHKSKKLVEQNSDVRINIVVPKLEQKRSQIEVLANQIFYPGCSPQQLQSQSLVYRFSLGKPLSQWETTAQSLAAIKLLNGKLEYAEFASIVRMSFAGGEVSHGFERILAQMKSRKMVRVGIHEALELCQQHVELYQEKEHQALPDYWNSVLAILQPLQDFVVELQAQLEQSKNKTQSYAGWAETIQAWLQLWTSVSRLNADADSQKHKGDAGIQHQLMQKWQDLLIEFASNDVLGRRVGLRRAQEVLNEMAREIVFQPQAPDSPILISGLFEAIGQRADNLFLLGMDESFPGVPRQDPFIPLTLLAEKGFPQASAQENLEQMNRVIEQLMAGSNQVQVSFAMTGQNEAEQRQPSPLFKLAKIDSSDVLDNLDENSELETQEYVDELVEPLDLNRKVRGGSAIFEHQAQCPFRAMTKFRFGYSQEQEPELGLDAAERGTAVHALMEMVWNELKSQRNIKDWSLDRIKEYANKAVDGFIQQQVESQDQKKQYQTTFLQIERNSLVGTVVEALVLDQRRPQSFDVIEKEQDKTTTFAEIPLRYSIDRVDLLEDGKRILIDYKTGNANKNDWHSEKIRKPQLPLYALLYQQEQGKQVDAIAFAQLKKGDFKYQAHGDETVSLGGNGKGRTLNPWPQIKDEWQDVLESLASHFKDGVASVSPIDEKICDYCDLAAMCRINQFRQHGSVVEDDSGEELEYD